MRSAGTPTRTRTSRILDPDALWITVVVLSTFCLYIATARPDVGGPEDSPKFQFLGFVLGTAHSPGYPLYVLLTHLFGKLPIGTLAFRVNVFSGLMGAAACSLVFVIARQLGAARVSALAVRRVVPLGGAAPWLSAVLALSLPCARLLAGEPQVAHLRRTDDAASFRALYAALPARAAVVYEDYWTESVLLYLHLSGEIVPDPSPAFIPISLRAARAAIADGGQLFAFAGSAAWLEATGLAFRPADLARSALASWLRQLPLRTRVAIATAGRPLPSELAPAGAGAGLSRPRSFGAMSWVVGDRSFVVDQGDSAATLSVPVPRRWWRRATASSQAIALAADAGGARIAIGPERVELPEGTVVVTVRPDGTTQRRLSYAPDAPLTVLSLVPLMTFDREAACETLDAGRTVDVSRVLENGGWLTRVDRLGTSVIDLRFPRGAAPVVRQRVLQGAGRTASESLADGRTRLVLDRTGWQRPIFRMTVLSAPGTVLASLAPGGVADATHLRALATGDPAAWRRVGRDRRGRGSRRLLRSRLARGRAHRKHALPMGRAQGDGSPAGEQRGWPRARPPALARLERWRNGTRDDERTAGGLVRAAGRRVDDLSLHCACRRDPHGPEPPDVDVNDERGASGEWARAA